MAYIAALRLRRFAELVRYYQVAAINTAFGFGLFALLIWLGVNLYVAQIIAQVCGVTFNYFSYSLHVFRNTSASKFRFIAAYGVNYLVNLSFLALFDLFVRSPYLTGFAATICASLLNYFMLKHVVFAERSSG